MASLVNHRAFKVGKFLAAGVPAGLIALPINYMLVESAHLNKPAAYAIVLLFQVAVNFFICRHFVFEKTSSASLRTQFVQFMSGILAFLLPVVIIAGDFGEIKCGDEE